MVPANTHVPVMQDGLEITATKVSHILIIVGLLLDTLTM